MDSIEIICLANSRKMSGNCIVGKTIKSNNWIRPVSNRETEEISKKEQCYENGDIPGLLDIIRIPIKKYKPTMYQKENYLIDDQYFWEKIGKYNKTLLTLVDTPNDLWGIGCSSYQGENDRIPIERCQNYKESVYLIRPQSFEIIVRVEGAEFENPKRKVRAQLNYNSREYLLPVTDPEIESEYLDLDDGIFKLSVENLFLCVSIGLPYTDGNCYKFIASLLRE